MGESTQQTLNTQVQTTQFSSLSEINHHIKQIQLCPFVSTHSPPFTCVQYIGILHHKIGASESFGDKIRNKNWDLIKVLGIRNHLIKQLFLRTAFLNSLKLAKINFSPMLWKMRISWTLRFKNKKPLSQELSKIKNMLFMTSLKKLSKFIKKTKNSDRWFLPNPSSTGLQIKRNSCNGTQKTSRSKA